MAELGKQQRGVRCATSGRALPNQAGNAWVCVCLCVFWFTWGFWDIGKTTHQYDTNFVLPFNVCGCFSLARKIMFPHYGSPAPYVGPSEFFPETQWLNKGAARSYSAHKWCACVCLTGRRLEDNSLFVPRSVGLPSLQPEAWMLYLFISPFISCSYSLNLSPIHTHTHAPTSTPTHRHAHPQTHKQVFYNHLSKILNFRLEYDIYEWIKNIIAGNAWSSHLLFFLCMCSCVCAKSSLIWTQHIRIDTEIWGGKKSSLNSGSDRFVRKKNLKDYYNLSTMCLNQWKKKSLRF